MTLREQLLSTIEAYCLATGTAEASISTQLFSGGRRIAQIRAGGDLGTVSFERAMAWFSANWPADAPWPEAVGRPLPRHAFEAAE